MDKTTTLDELILKLSAYSDAGMGRLPVRITREIQSVTEEVEDGSVDGPYMLLH